MLTFVKSVQASDGKVFPTLEAGMTYEIALILAGSSAVQPSDHNAAAQIVEAREKIVDILTTTPNSKPKARAINGGRKPRKKPEAAETTRTESTLVLAGTPA